MSGYYDVSYTDLGDGTYSDDKGNLYHEELVLRYRVMYQRSDTKNPDRWSLYSSHAKKEKAVEFMQNMMNEEPDAMFNWMLKDTGEPTKIKRLIY